jgi:hypothetical protein
LVRRWTLAATLAAAALAAAHALAQNAAAPALSKAKAKAADGATAAVMVTNSRKTDLIQLQVAESGSANWRKVLGGLKSGKQAAAQVPHGFNCRVDLHGTFVDGQSLDVSDVDVCKEKTLNLTD